MTRWMGLVGLLLAAAIGLFLYSKQMTSIAPGAGTGAASPRATIDVTGVRNDLLAFANASPLGVPSTGLLKTAGYVVLIFAALGLYLFAGAA